MYYNKYLTPTKVMSESLLLELIDLPDLIAKSLIVTDTCIYINFRMRPSQLST